MAGKDKELDIQEEVQIRKAQRSRKRLRIIIALIIVAIVAVIALLVVFASKQTVEPEAAATGGTLYEQGRQVDDAAVDVAAITSIPNLASYKGMTVDEVLADLGGRGTLVTTEATEDADSAAIVQLADIKISPDPGVETDETTGAELYLGLDADGHVVKVYYAVSLDRLGNDDLSFDSILQDTDFLQETLSKAGCHNVSVDVDVPEESAYATYTTDAQGNQVLSKCSYTYEGKTGLSSPDTWQVTYTYDYVTTQVTSTSDVTRFMYIKLL